MLRYRDGDVRAFEDLYARHRGGVFRYVLRQVGLPLRRRGNIPGSVDQYHLLARPLSGRSPLRHVSVPCGAQLRDRPFPPQAAAAVDCARRRRRRSDADRRVRSRNNRNAPWRGGRRQGQLLRALALLPDEQREAFLLHEEGGLTLEEIADVTRVGRETVKSRLRYALAKLRQELNGSGMSHEADVA